jgi:Ser/Thr protein kinase RdoA (MazF antagonist)
MLEVRGQRVLGAELLWERRHIMRVHTNGSSVVAKLATKMRDGKMDRGSLQSEAAALTLFHSMPNAVAPRLIGFDPELDLVVMEELPPGEALADFLLLGEPASAQSAMAKLAVALASLHAYSSSREDEYRTISATLTSPKLRRPWMQRALEDQQSFLTAVGSLVSTEGLESDVGHALNRLQTTHYRGLVHGDLCPDNVRVIGDGIRIFDFEGSMFGPIALDAAYFLAPFPSCWCFAELPESVALDAFATYEHELSRLGITLDDEFCVDVAAALGTFLVAWLGQLPEVLKVDDPWGTTTMRPRIRRWLSAFVHHEASATAFPKLHAAARELIDLVTDRWPDLATPQYPAFAHPDDAVTIPDFWRPGL